MAWNPSRLASFASNNHFNRRPRFSRVGAAGYPSNRSSSIASIGSRLVASRVRNVLQMLAKNKTPDLFARLTLDLNRDYLQEVQQG
jgi:pyridoxine/pyridoxamine 5'-phosphate oxidase